MRIILELKTKSVLFFHSIRCLFVDMHNAVKITNKFSFLMTFVNVSNFIIFNCRLPSTVCQQLNLFVFNSIAFLRNHYDRSDTFLLSLSTECTRIEITQRNGLRRKYFKMVTSSVRLCDRMVNERKGEREFSVKFYFCC